MKVEARRTDLERSAKAGDSPVVESGILASGTPSRSGHVEPGLNLRGPSRKAKHSSMTDSELSRVTERWEEPPLGEDTEPETMCLQAVGALWSFIGQCVTACLLHNDPASYRLRLGEGLTGHSQRETESE